MYTRLAITAKLHKTGNQVIQDWQSQPSYTRLAIKLYKTGNQIIQDWQLSYTRLAIKLHKNGNQVTQDWQSSYVLPFQALKLEQPIFHLVLREAVINIAYQRFLLPNALL